MRSYIILLAIIALLSVSALAEDIEFQIEAQVQNGETHADLNSEPEPELIAHEPEANEEVDTNDVDLGADKPETEHLEEEAHQEEIHEEDTHTDEAEHGEEHKEVPFVPYVTFVAALFILLVLYALKLIRSTY